MRLFGCIAVCALLVACSGSTNAPSATSTAAPSTTVAPTSVSTPATVEPYPPGVPASATELFSNADFGSPQGSTGDPASTQLFYSQSCTGGVLVLVTNQVTLYAELPCDRSLPQRNVEPFLGKPVELRVTVGSPTKLRMLSVAAGSVEFTVGRVWLVR